MDTRLPLSMAKWTVLLAGALVAGAVPVSASANENLFSA